MYWGTSEAFFEGWYHASLIQNILLSLFQYLSIPIILIICTTAAINHKKSGLILFFIIAFFAIIFFHSNAGRVLVALPSTLFALGFYFAEFKYKKNLFYITVTLPALIVIIFAMPQIIKINNRQNDGDFGERKIRDLTWAAQGPGFPLSGTDWYTALEKCTNLGEEWRLPTREEILLAAGENPDKETPLWNPHSQVIYYWTSEEKDEGSTYLVAFNGRVLARQKSSGPDYQGYRCVK